MVAPLLINGDCFSDYRGRVFFNNTIDLSQIKRFYFIENKNIDIIRAWQGHKIEQRWFTVVKGVFKIQLIAIDNWLKPTKSLKPFKFVLKANQMDVLHVPPGYVSSIQSLETDSKLLVMADYLLGELDDEFRYDLNYFAK
jgi:dTDP-4-dehydrorhamnose 3,5-epimerase-like enzyme